MGHMGHARGGMWDTMGRACGMRQAGHMGCNGECKGGQKWIGGGGGWQQFFTQLQCDVTYTGCGTLPTLLAAIILSHLYLMYTRLYTLHCPPGCLSFLACV